MYARPDSEYFLGSIVLQKRQVKNGGDADYEENDLLDGQQRLSTCLMIHAVGRDLAGDDKLRTNCRKVVFQEEDPYDGIPERLRIVYDVRDEVREFINRFIRTDGEAINLGGLQDCLNARDLSVRNMANAMIEINRFFTQDDPPNLENFFKFFRNKVLMVYVASDNLEDAFRMFTVLNDRGMKLRGSDILKTLNLRALREDKSNDAEIKQWARFWEEMEGELGDDFDVFLSHLRSILVKDKARLSLLQEFEDNIYKPREFDKVQKTYKDRTPLLQPGRDTFRFVERYFKHYQQILSGNNYHLNNSWQFDNLITLLSETSLANFWLPPLLHYREVFGEIRLLDFLRKLETKFCGDWITAQTPTDRISAINRITSVIDQIKTQPNLSMDQRVASLLASPLFNYDHKRFREILETNTIYSRRYARYLLFKLDLLYASPDTKLQVPSQMSVEHILPQHPDTTSQWCKDFTLEQREEWTDRLGNLILISRRKNSSQGRLDFRNKKEKYFKSNVEIFPHAVRVMQVDRWDMQILVMHHTKVIDKLCEH